MYLSGAFGSAKALVFSADSLPTRTTTRQPAAVQGDLAPGLAPQRVGGGAAELVGELRDLLRLGVELLLHLLELCAIVDLTLQDLAQLAACVGPHGAVNDFAVTEVLRRAGCLHPRTS